LNQFGINGVRVKRLLGLQKESEGKWKQAESIYKKILEEDPANTVRMISFAFN
jgi:hypothetical protein